MAQIDDPQTPVAPFSILLSEGSEQPQIIEPLPVASGEPLTEEEISAILDRSSPQQQNCKLT